VVGAADESWFDYWPVGSTAREHELRVRRGGLILGITLSGTRGAKEKDPREVLVGLANLVLRRLPHVGATDTGSTHRIEYEVMGTAKASSIDYDDYTLTQFGHAQNVRLPWIHAVAVAYGGGGTRPNPPALNAVASPPTAKIGCRVIIDGMLVDEEIPHEGFVACAGFFRQTTPDAAQPASWRFTGLAVR
jgi:hypothetical protein